MPPHPAPGKASSPAFPANKLTTGAPHLPASPTPFTYAGPALADARACETVLRALPAWFGIEEAIVQYVHDIARRPTVTASRAACEPPQLVGFLTLTRHFKDAAEIHVMGVLPDEQGQGVGRAMLQHAEAWLIERGVKYLLVKTLSARRDCPEYALTRRFYRSVGFVDLEELPTLWGERNPCLQLIKSLHT